MLKKKQEHDLMVEEEYKKYLVAQEEKKKEKLQHINEKSGFKKSVSKFIFNVSQTKLCLNIARSWKKFTLSNPSAAKGIREFASFFVFSCGITVFQYLVMTFLPYSFGKDLAAVEWFWPNIKMATIEGREIFWHVLGYSVVKDAAGNVIIGGGLGYFLAFEIATFLAQAINFPLQRNITFKSKGNVYYQLMWYFFAWIAISLLSNAINGAWMPFASIYLPPAVYNIIVTLMSGGISFVVFFFVFKIIFPTEKKEETSEK